MEAATLLCGREEKSSYRCTFGRSTRVCMQQHQHKQDAQGCAVSEQSMCFCVRSNKESTSIILKAILAQDIDSLLVEPGHSDM